MKKSTITIAACSFIFLSIAVALAFGALLLDSPVPDLSNEFKTGFLASLWEDVVFFSTIGLAAILFQMIFRPQESFFNRMKSIFGNRIKYTESLHEYIGKKFEDFLSYLEWVYVEIDIRDVSKDKNIVEVQVLRKMLIGNLSSDLKSGHELKVSVTPDGMADGKYPTLSDIQTCERSDVSLDDPRGATCIFEGRDVEQALSEKCDRFAITSKRFRWYKFSIKFWSDLRKDSEIYELTQERYIKRADIVLVNSSSFQIWASIKSKNGEEKIAIKPISRQLIEGYLNDNQDNVVFSLNIDSVE